LETVVKVGGSLSATGDLYNLMQALTTLADAHQILVVPGGGGFADTVRYYHRKYALREAVSHQMAILGMDQYGLLLHGIAPNSQAVRTISEARQALALKRLPVLIPSVLLFTTDPLPHSWSVTSDSLSAFVAKMVGARRLVLLKDVDGIFSSDPHQGNVARLLPSVAASDLDLYKCVDRHFSKALEGIPEGWILNGSHPERLAQLLKEGQTLGTRIYF